MPKEVIDAVTEGDTTSLLQWIKSTKSIDAKDTTGRTALHLASERGEDVCMRLLLENGADPLSVDNKLQTPLHLLASKGHGRMVKMLLDRGADPMVTNSDGKSAMDLAADSQSVGALRLMKVHQHKVEQGMVVEVQYGSAEARLRVRN